MRHRNLHCSEGHEAPSVRDFEIGMHALFASYAARDTAQAQAHCRAACDHTRHCKRVRSFDDHHVLVLLGPAHLVPAGFWDAAQSLLEPRGSLGPQSLCCFQVPVVTTVPITQVKPIAAIIVPATTSVPFSDEELTGAAC